MRGSISIEYGILLMVLLGGYIMLLLIHLNDGLTMQEDVKNLLSARLSLLRVKAAGEFTEVSDGFVKMGVWVPNNTTIDLRELRASVRTETFNDPQFSSQCPGGVCIIDLDSTFSTGPTINQFTQVKVSKNGVETV